MDDICTVPRLSTHWISFQNHTLQAKEEAESDKKLNQAPKACGGSGRLGELGRGVGALPVLGLLPHLMRQGSSEGIKDHYFCHRPKLSIFPLMDLA